MGLVSALLPRPATARFIIAAVGTGLVGTTGSAHSQTVNDRTLPPAGYGSLHQADVAIRLESGSVQLRVLPLDERVLRLLAPDTYRSLHDIRVSRRDEIAATETRAGLLGSTVFLVTVFGRADGSRFAPDALALVHRNQRFPVEGIIPLSSGWGLHTLSRGEAVNALYLFDGSVEVLEPIVVQYGATSSNRWSRTLERLERERARVTARANHLRGGTR